MSSAAPVVHPTAAAAADWLRERGARGLAADSRRLQPGEGFVAWPGHTVDARRFVGAALASGAPACLVEAAGVEAYGFADERVAALAGLKAAGGEVASRYLGEPSAALQVLAVTGTNGKTSCTWWLAQALGALGRSCGVVGTLGVGVPPAVSATGLTTPDPVGLQRAFRGFVDAGQVACAIEASSIGLVEHRLAGTRIAVALFTNLSRDHLDFHGSEDAYWQAKAALFAWPGLRAAVVNVDDAHGAALAASLGLPAEACWTTSRAGAAEARLRAADVAYVEGGLAFEALEGEDRAVVRTRLIGDYNAANLLTVIGGLRALGVPLADAAAACAALTPVPGRMQRVGHVTDALPDVIVDYAHTPDALEKALVALRPFAQARGGVLWCVFGCGGDRDATKRPLMGAIAERLADHVVVTSDNPRSESPAFILAQILAGVTGHDDVAVIEDRADAIREAVTRAGPADVVLVAGKGHEDYQEIAGARRPFSDVEQAQAALALRAST